jgi:hypothetical protein
MCNNSCNECPRKVYSSGISVVTVATVPTLVIDVPLQSFRNCQRGCIVLTQNLPAAATISMPVAISIGGDTTTVYPVVSCNCNQVTACALRPRRRYPFKVATTPTGAVFKVLKNLSCSPDNNLLTIPVIEATAPADEIGG